MAMKQSPPIRSKQSNSSQGFQRAVKLHQQGKLDQAERIYTAILATQPNHFDALHLLGMLRSQQGRNAQALHYIGAALKLKPSSVAALSIFGLVHARLSHFEEALASYDQVLALKPDYTEALNNRGNVLKALKRPAEALASYDRALALKPDYAEALYNRGNVLVDLKRPEEALASYDKALAFKPDFAEALKNRGNVLKQLKRLEEALASHDQALALKPDYIEALNNRGEALIDLKRPEEALASYDRALALKPDYAEALKNRGNVLKQLKRFAEALASYDRALALKPDYAEALNNRGNVLDHLKRPAEALASYDQALVLKPDYADVYNNRAILLIELGRFKEASNAIEKAIERAPRKARSYYNLTTSKRLVPGDPNIRAMEELARDMPSLTVDEQIDLYFALGKAFADTEDHERSFRYLLAGTALKRKQTVYDEAGTLGLFERTRTVFTCELMRRNKALGEPSCVPVFILGMPRSGTTLVEQILASHPKVFGAGEIDDFDKAIVNLSGTTGGTLHFPEVVSLMSGDQIRHFGASYVGGIRVAAPTAERITNKTPGGFRFTGFIHLVLPNARIIHTRRDPIDTCLSCFSILFTENQPYTYDLEELGRYYRAYEALMAHWRSVLPQNVMLEVQYEEVVADLEGQARRIVAHCGLEWDDACLDFHKTQRLVRTASAIQVRQPIYKSSVGRWRAYEPFLGPLLAELEPSITSIIPDLQERSDAGHGSC
jgi:tetratricopeptide (TPR) repeat protein